MHVTKDVAKHAVSVCLASIFVAAVSTASFGQTAGDPSDCSGILCLFGSRSSASPQDAPPASPPAEAVATAASGTGAHQAKEKVKPAPPIVIAADASERSRLKALGSMLPKQPVKIVDANVDAAKADFEVSTSIAPRGEAGKVKLFSEEMHIVANSAIHSVKDLNGKVVSFGVDKSASQAAAQKAFAALDVQVKETPLEVDNALDGLASGDIDAVVLLAPRPDERLKRIAAPGLHLVAWPDDGPLPEGAAGSSVEVGDYPSLAKPGEAVRTLQVEAVLTSNPKETRRSAERKFLAALSQHSAQLSKHGFDLLKADRDGQKDHRVASAEKR